MPLSTILQLNRFWQFDWWRKAEYPEKTTDLSQDTDKLYHIIYRTRASLEPKSLTWLFRHLLLIIIFKVKISKDKTIMKIKMHSLIKKMKSVVYLL
jgi:hypothetical protein